MVEYDLKDVATVSGKPGLYQVVKPTRSGVIIETLDDSKRRMMIQTRHKISLLQEISIFTTDEEGSIPLDQVFSAIHNNYGTDLIVDLDSGESELRDFIGEVIPEYDEERVYTSDIKKLISWYGIINKFAPPKEKEVEKPKAKAKATKKTEEKTPAKDKPEAKEKTKKDSGTKAKAKTKKEEKA